MIWGPAHPTAGRSLLCLRAILPEEDGLYVGRTMSSFHLRIRQEIQPTDPK